MTMWLTSSAFERDGTIPRRYSCDGENLSPPLAWEGAPDGTKSFVLLCDDPDAPRGTFRHWAIFDIPADLHRLPEGVEAAEAPEIGMRQAINDFGKPGYGGPCPPRGHGPHRYFFRLLALGVDRLRLERESGCERVMSEAQPHVLASAGLVGRYER